MRPPLVQDLLLLARSLMPYPAADRIVAASKLIAEAGAALEYFQKHQQNHPQFGDGSLLARALALSPRPEPVLTDPDFLNALQTAIGALIHHQSRCLASQL
jgi:hypothetical protein